MSEYWKSTPKYWCKHCSTFVRDTKLEKANHEATPKHQGNLKRFLRDLHRGHEKDQKDKDRAKAEVARLNGVVAGAGQNSNAAGPSGSSGTKDGVYARPQAPKPQATEAQRKQQLAQLVEMGIAIPDEFRPDMAMAGEWQVTSETVLEEEGEKKPEAIALGVRKRMITDEEQEAQESNKRRWGSTYRSHPGQEEDADLDTLLNNATHKDKGIKKEEPEIKQEEPTNGHPENKASTTSDRSTVSDNTVQNLVKQESLDDTSGIAEDVKQDTEAVTGIVFKKRKTKNIRHK